MKLWAMPCRATQDRQVMQAVLTKRGPLEKEWQTISLFLPWEPYEQYKKAKWHDTEDELPRSVGAPYATGEEWRNNYRKNERWNQSKNNTQLWMWRVMEVKSDAVKSNIA